MTNTTGNKKTKRQKIVSALFDAEKKYSLKDGVSILKQYSQSSKFDETVEVSFNLGVDPRQPDQMLRSTVPLPHGRGKEIRVAVILNAESVKAAKEAGADIAGAEDLIEEIKGGRLDFDVCIATPDMMPKMAVLGKLLGPKGKMPSPKAGTVDADFVKAIKAVKAGRVEFKTEKAGIVHAGAGKLSFSEDAIIDNISAIYEAVVSAKPSASKGVYIKAMTVSSTQGPGVAIDLGEIKV